MDINEELLDLQKQKQIQRRTDCNLDFAEYKKRISNRLQRIDGELEMLLHEIAGNGPDGKADHINSIIENFKSKEISALHEELKQAFYFLQKKES